LDLKDIADKFFCRWRPGNGSFTVKCVFISALHLPLRGSATAFVSIPLGFHEICFHPGRIPAGYWGAQHPSSMHQWSEYASTRRPSPHGWEDALSL